MNDKELMCPVCGGSTQGYMNIPYALFPGITLNGRYFIGKVISQDSFGITYICRDIRSGVIAALREYYPAAMAMRNTAVSCDIVINGSKKDKKIYERSVEEVINDSSLKFEFVSLIYPYDCFKANNTVYTVSRIPYGQRLQDHIDTAGVMEYDAAVCMLMPFIDELKELHKRGIYHRSIVPDNIYLTDCGAILSGFGVPSCAPFAVPAGGFCYTPIEMYRKEYPEGAWTDVYEICAIIYRCITGKIPPAPDSRLDYEVLIPPSQLGIEIDPMLDKMLMHGLAPDPEYRIHSIEQMIAELSETPPKWQRSRAASRRRRI